MLNSSTCFLQDGENNSEGGALAKFTLALDVALMEGDDLLDVG